MLDKQQNIIKILLLRQKEWKVAMEEPSKGLRVKWGIRLLPVWIALFLLFCPGELDHRNREKTSDMAHAVLPPQNLPRIREKPAANLKSRAGNAAEQRFYGLILAASKRYDVDPDLVKALIKAESGYDPKAISPRGAVGLMQLMPSLAASLGVKDAFDPAHNVHGGVKHLSDLLEHFDGSVCLALAAYHAGVNRVKGRPQLPRSTERYVERVLQYYHHYKTGMEEGGNRA
ncbi:MAG: lytic transglycosylase domain-containing protein [Deltaproteobacteria bacterium]|nr:lytic transglycosylase domain-containing protein [Deltaproteobacteria bacterium]